MSTHDALFLVVGLAIVLTILVTYLTIQYMRRPNKHLERRRSDRMIPNVFALQIVITCLIGAISLIAFANADRSNRALHYAESVRYQAETRSVRRATGQCLRVQVLRAKQVNYLEASQFYTDYVVATLGTSASVVSELGVLKDGYATTGPTNCDQAVARPLTYRPPEPQKMTLKVACATISKRFSELGEAPPHLRYCKER